MRARLAAARAADRDGRGSSAPRSPRRRCQGSSVRRRSVGNPSPSSRVRVEQQVPGRDDRAAAALGVGACMSSAAGSAAGASTEALPDAPTSLTKRSAVAPRRAPRELPDRRVEPMPAAVAGARSPALPEQQDLRLLRTLPICTAARPTAAAGRVPDRRTTSPRTTSGVGKSEGSQAASPQSAGRAAGSTPTGAGDCFSAATAASC
jgi:hypothetical protein